MLVTGSSAPVSDPSRRLPRRQQPILLILVIGAGSLSLGIFTLVFNLYVIAAGRTHSELGFILASGTIGAAIAVLPAGVASDAWGRRRVFLVGGILAALATFAQCSVTSFVPLLGWGVVSGMAGAVLGVVALPALVESVPEGQASSLLSVAGAIALVGATAGAALGGWLPAMMEHALPSGRSPADLRLLSYRLTLYAGLLSAGAACLPALMWYRDPMLSAGRRRAVAWSWAGMGRVQRDGVSLWKGIGGPYLLVNVVIGIGAGWVIPYLNLYFTQERGFSLAQYGLVSAAGSLALAPATLLAPALARRIGTPMTVALGQLLSLPALALLAVATGPVLLATSYCVRLALMDMSSPLAQGFVLERLPAVQRGTYSSLLLIAFQVPWAGTSALGGWLQPRIGYDPLFLLTAVCYIPGACIFWWAYRGTREPYESYEQREGREADDR